VHHFDVVDVQDEEGELGEGDKALLSGPNTHNLLLWATREGQGLFWDIDEELGSVALRSFLDNLGKVQESLVKASTLLSLSLFLLKLIHLVHLVAALEVDVLRRDTRLLVELYIHGWFLTNQDWLLQVEMQDDD